MITLDKRLSAISSLIRKGTAVIDIGTDHALLPCCLKENGQPYVLAADINKEPLESAKKNVLKYKMDIELILSNGFQSIDSGQIPPLEKDIIIAGMGGETIVDILSDERAQPFFGKNNRFILQPMTKHEVLRKWLYENKFLILRELFIQDLSHKYIVLHIMYEGERIKHDDIMDYVGENPDPLYLQDRIQKLEKVCLGEPSLLPLYEKIKERERLF